jgi:hypothetical protein
MTPQVHASLSAFAGSRFTRAGASLALAESPGIAHMAKERAIALRSRETARP